MLGDQMQNNWIYNRVVYIMMPILSVLLVLTFLYIYDEEVLHWQARPTVHLYTKVKYIAIP